NRIKKINKFINGPKGYPIIGNLFDLKKNGLEIHETFHELYLKYGPIFRIRFGSIETVILSEYSTIKECFIDNGESLTERYIRKSRLRASKGLNIGNANGEYWKFLYSTISPELTATKLKKVIEGHIKCEIKEYCKFMDSCCENEKPFHFNLYARVFTLNCVLRSLFNINYPYVYIDPKIDIGTNLGDYVQNGGKVVWGDFVPFLYFFLKNKPQSFYSSYENLKQHVSKFVDRAMEKIKDEDFDTYKPESIAESLLIQYKKGNIVYDAVVTNSMDLLLGGIDTSANTLCFSTIAVLNNNLQDKLYNSISNGLHGDTQDDDANNNTKIFLYSKYKTKFNYVTLVLRETFRRYAPVPLGLQHRLTNDIEINGYKIAKGTQFFQNVYSSHMTASTWAEPKQFIPERFENNNLHQQLCHYGIGLRKCIGFIMADSELFSFLSTVFYRYQFINPSSDKLNDRGGFSLALQAPKTILKVKKRLNK
ncbi:hypothetical protein DICPUDRAFT_31424, partial [Dictyostelium purpureum]